MWKREAFAAFPGNLWIFDHDARTVFVQLSARPVKHVLRDQFVQPKVYGFVRYFTRNYLIYMFSCSGLIVWIGHNEQDVEMRQSAFLVPEGPSVSADFSKDFVLEKVFEQGIQFEFEDAGDQV